MGKIFARRTRKIKDKCDIETIIVDGGLLMKCKNIKRKPTEKEAMESAQSILDSIKNNKIIFK